MIGILPCAGKAERLHGIPKWLLPIPDSYLLKWHVEGMKLAGCEDVYIGCNPINYQQVAQFATDNGTPYVADNYETMSQTVLSAWGDAQRTNVLFGMPDTYWTSPKVYGSLASAVKENMVAVALFKKRPHERSGAGMCEIDSHNRLTQVIDKPESTRLQWAWIAMAWQPEFWQYIQPNDSHVGFALQRAIESGVYCQGLFFDGRSFDCGTLSGFYNMLKAVMK